MSKILVFTSKSDLHADYVIKKMVSMGIDCFRFNSDEMPTVLKVSYSLGRGYIIWNSKSGQELHLSSLADSLAVWYRKPLISRFDANSRRPAVAFVMRETEACLTDVIASISSAKWVNHPEANRLADKKLAQLRLAQSLGIRVPRTIVTNDPQTAKGFEESVRPAGMIYKTLTYPFIEETSSTFRSVFTSSVHLSSERLIAVQAAPCFFQEEVPKAYELRVTVVGEHVFAARIYSQDQEATSLDWRRNQHEVVLRQEVEDLKPEIKSACLEITKRLGLVFGALDFIVTPDGEHVFLEINPNGQWLWKEVVLGLRISDALINELTC